MAPKWKKNIDNRENSESETSGINIKKKSIYQKYFEEQDKYTQICGEKTIVFFQVGKFYDAYCDKKRGYSKLAELEPLLNIHFIRRPDDVKKNPHHKPNQFGINCVSIKKNLTTLIENGYTIVLFDQKTNGDSDVIERICKGVYSPGTYISDRQTDDANYILCAYIKEERQISGKNTLMAIGVTIIDITTGTSMVHEFYSDKMDEKFGLDELIRMLQTFYPTELIIYYYPVEINETVIVDIKSYLELEKFKNHRFYVYNDGAQKNKIKYDNKCFHEDKLQLLTSSSFKIGVQNDYLADVYGLNHQVGMKNHGSAIEVMHLQKKPYVIISLMIVLKYISEHSIQLLKNLSVPDIYVYNRHLILGNNAIEQLNIIDSNKLEFYNQRYKSVFDVINRTSTPMGKRFLKESLMNPLSQKSKNVIVSRYDMIDELMKQKLTHNIRDELKQIFDVERLHRRMALGSITPYEFYRLDTYYKATTRIISLIKSNKILKTTISDTDIKEFVSFQSSYQREYDFDIVKDCNNFSNITKSFFLPGKHAKIDKIQTNIDVVNDMIDSISDYLTGLIKKYNKSSGSKTVSKNILELESNDRNGYYFTITKSNEKILKKHLDNKSTPDTIKIVTKSKTFKIGKSDIVFKPLPKGRTKIFVKQLEKHTVNLARQTTILIKLIKKEFIKSMNAYFTQYKEMMHKICRFISEIDFLVSGAIVAQEYSYCRPIIPSMKGDVDESESTSSEKSTKQDKIPSYFKAKCLRHAIIERLCNETEYVPNDIEMGNIPGSSMNGVLLYGLNSAGKSALMKSIGVAIHLAQIGQFVPATSFEYEPYMGMYARITGNDNIFKGLSSFALEMTELDAIILRVQAHGENTIVIGDEVCRGTEDISGLSIVASTLVSLSNCRSTYIFSSHLHQLPEIEEVKKLDNLRLLHLRVEYDELNDCLIFDRKLTPGSGPRVYGLSVAKYLIKNQSFINRAEKIKQKLINEMNLDANGFSIPSIGHKSSNYNSDRLVKSCAICNYCPKQNYHKELECHHIHFQKNCLEDGKIIGKPYLSKNKLYNLVVLCRTCHMRVHNGEITIRGYSDTSIGPLLDYCIDVKKTMINGIKKLDKIYKPDKITKSNQILTKNH